MSRKTSTFWLASANLALSGSTFSVMSSWNFRVMTVLSIEILIASAAILLGFLQLPLLVECFAAAWPRRSDNAPVDRSQPADILIPARNESQILPSTLRSLQSQLRPDDHVWLIADNCTDDTAEVARAEGVHVIERENAMERGKGFALQYAIDRIDPRPDGVAVILDADCQLDPEGLDRIVRLAAETQEPVQSRYQMTPSSTGPRAELSHFALLLKNTVRQRGLSRLGLPCVLSGSGMAFPWSILRSSDLASDNTADDLQLTCDLALAGHRVQFCDDAAVTASLPANPGVIKVQRKRWIHGHLRTAFRYLPRLWWSGISRFRLPPIAVACEVAVPPLSILVLLHLTLIVTGLLFGAATHHWLAAGLACVSAGFLIAGIGFAWLCFGRAVLPLRSIGAVPAHIFGSLVSSVELLFRRQHWTPTERDVRPAGDKGIIP